MQAKRIRQMFSPLSGLHQTYPFVYGVIFGKVVRGTKFEQITDLATKYSAQARENVCIKACNLVGAIILVPLSYLSLMIW